LYNNYYFLRAEIAAGDEGEPAGYGTTSFSTESGIYG